MSAGARGHRLDAAVALLAAVASLAVYIRSLAPGLLWGDSAEFQFAAWLGGFVHPTGYPLYLILGWLWSHLLPIGDPAFRMNLFSAVWGAVAVGLFCLLVMRVLRFVSPPDPTGFGLSFGPEQSSGRSSGSLPGPAPGQARLIALGAALVFTFAPTFWSQAVIAEVYTMHAAFVAALLLALIAWAERALAEPAPSRRSLAPVIGLLFGLSLAHHRATILLIPAALVFVLVVLSGKSLRNGTRPAARVLAATLISALAPLLLYLYIPLAAANAPYTHLRLSDTDSLALYDGTLRGFFAHVSGSTFGSSLAAPGSSALNLSQLSARFVTELGANGVLLALVGVGALVAGAFVGTSSLRRRNAAILALTGLFFVTQVAFNLFYAIGDIHVFYIPAYLVAVLWLALGAWALLRAARRFLLPPETGNERSWPLRLALAGAVALILLAFAYRSAVVFWPQVQRASDDSARRAWEGLLASPLPTDAVLVSNDRDEMVPLWYMTYVEGRRRDLTGLFPLIGSGPRWAHVASVTDAALATGRPVYLVKPMPGLDLKYDLSPVNGQPQGPLGPTVRVSARQDATPAAPVGLTYGEAVELVGYDLPAGSWQPGGKVQVILYWQPLQPLRENWITFVHVEDGAGRRVGQSDHQAGGVFYPSSLWMPGEMLRDSHTITLTSDAGDGPYRLMAGMYVPEGDGLRQLGEPRVIGEVAAPGG